MFERSFQNKAVYIEPVASNWLVVRGENFLVFCMIFQGLFKEIGKGWEVGARLERQIVWDKNWDDFDYYLVAEVNVDKNKPQQNL